MSDPRHGGDAPSDKDRLLDLLGLVVQGDATDQEFTEFEGILATSDGSRTMAVRFMHMHALIERFELDDSVSLPLPPLARRIPFLGQLGRFVHVTRNSVIAATLLIAALIYGVFAYLAWDLRSGKLASDRFGTDSPLALVTGATNVQWSADTLPKPIATPLLPGELLKITGGRLKLNLPRGVDLVVEAPAEWSIESDNRVMLRSGKLHANVSVPAIGFTVTTPTAHVVDLGTEFTVNVGESGATEVNVLQGTVEVGQCKTQPTANTTKSVRLSAGQTLQVNSKGLGSITIAPNSTKGELAQVTTKFLDLVDIVAGGDGRGHRRDRGIDTASGRIIFVPDNDYSVFSYFPSDGYRRPDDRPFIDGVGIPDPSRGPVQLDSAGHTYAHFPKTSGDTYGPLWAGGAVPESPDRAKLRTTFDGKVDYSLAPHGLISLIPNKLITFDLAALRKVHPNCLPTMLHTVTGLSKPVPLPGGYSEGLADVWVFVDGELRFNRLGIRATDGSFTIEVPLSPTAQFLTFATTDGGNLPHFDWVFFGDPRIELESSKASSTQKNLD